MTTPVLSPASLFQQLSNSELYSWMMLAKIDPEEAKYALASAIYASRRTGAGEDNLLMEVYEKVFNTKELPPQD